MVRLNIHCVVEGGVYIRGLNVVPQQVIFMPPAQPLQEVIRHRWWVSIFLVVQAYSTVQVDIFKNIIQDIRHSQLGGGGEGKKKETLIGFGYASR